MIAEILETVLTIIGAILVLLIAIAGYYFSYTLYRDYRKDPCFENDKWILFGAIIMAFLATVMGLVLLCGIAEFMGW